MNRGLSYHCGSLTKFRLGLQTRVSLAHTGSDYPSDITQNRVSRTCVLVEARVRAWDAASIVVLNVRIRRACERILVTSLLVTGQASNLTTGGIPSAVNGILVGVIVSQRCSDLTITEIAAIGAPAHVITNIYMCLATYISNINRN